MKDHYYIHAIVQSPKVKFTKETLDAYIDGILKMAALDPETKIKEFNHIKSVADKVKRGEDISEYVDD